MRLVHAVIAALLLTLLAPPAQSSAPEPSSYREQRARVSLTATPEWVKRGDIVTLRGTVSGVRGRVSVTIFQKTKGKSWVVEAVKRTTRKGRFTHREDVKAGDRTYKACVKRACDSVLVHMGQQPKQTTAVSLTGQSASTVEAGQAFTVSGTASPNLNGQQVQIQTLDAATSAWSAVSSATVQNSQWSTTTSISTAGRSVPIRAVFAGSAGLRPSISNQSGLAVYGWYYMYDGMPERVASTGTYDYDSYNVNGTNYSKSIGIYGYTGSTEYVEFNLGRSCIRLAAVVGLNDEATTTTRVTGRINVDSVTKWTQAGMGLGAAYPIAIDISNGLRLRLEYTETTSGNGYLAFGDLRALCAF